MTSQPVIEIGGTHVTTAIVDTDRKVVTYQERHTIDASTPASELLDAIAAGARTAPVTSARRWGVAIPGPFDYENGIGAFAGVAKFGALSGVDVGLGLLERLQSPAEQIVFVNDAEAFAIGEWHTSPAPLARTVYLTLGTGIGSSFLLNGRPVANWPGIPANGYLYLLSWQGRPLEEVISRRAIQRDYKSATGLRADVHEISQRTRDGDIVARSVLDNSFETLGKAIAPAVQSFGAQAVVVGGSIAKAGDLICEPLRAGLRSVVVRGAVVPEVRAAHSIDTSPILGTALEAQRARPIRFPGIL